MAQVNNKMHVYKVYDVDKDGNKFDTGKTITAEPPSFNSNYYYGQYEELIHGGTIVEKLMEIFGFTEYLNYYRLRKPKNSEHLEISTNFHEGEKTVWVLKKGI